MVDWYAVISKRCNRIGLFLLIMMVVVLSYRNYLKTAPSSGVEGFMGATYMYINRDINNTHPVALTIKMTPTKKRRQIVIVFGVCLSKGAKQQVQQGGFGIDTGRHPHDKKSYDVVAAILATRLWVHQYPSLKVVVLVTTMKTVPSYAGGIGGNQSHQSEEEVEVARFSRLIRAAGGTPWVVNTDFSSHPERACIRAAQLGRAFLHESGLVNDDDIVVTSDSDAFVVNATARLAPLWHLIDHDDDVVARLWISNYGHALRKQKTIPFCFIGQSAADWRLSWRMTPQNLTFQIKMPSNDALLQAHDQGETYPKCKVIQNSSSCDYTSCTTIRSGGSLGLGCCLYLLFLPACSLYAILQHYGLSPLSLLTTCLIFLPLYGDLHSKIFSPGEWINLSSLPQL
jgi:hypothetical protein